MTDDLAGSEKQEGVRTRGHGEPLIWAAMWLCLVLAAIAFTIGLNMAFERRLAPCPDGTFFPEGAADFNCYVHPEAAPGTAIALFAVLLGTIVVFSGISAALAVQVRARR